MLQKINITIIFLIRRQLSMFYFIIGITALLLLVYGIILYNGLVQVKHNVSKAWANIDVILKQRYDELPKLIEVCKQCRDFEQSTLLRLVDARTDAQVARQNQDIARLSIAEGKMQKGLQHLFAVAESYPTLQTNQNFLQLQKSITDLESSLADRRELYNESVNINNIRIEQFPDIIIAKLLSFKMHQLLETTPTEQKDIDIKTLFN